MNWVPLRVSVTIAGRRGGRGREGGGGGGGGGGGRGGRERGEDAEEEEEELVVLRNLLSGFGHGSGIGPIASNSREF